MIFLGFGRFSHKSSFYTCKMIQQQFWHSSAHHKTITRPYIAFFFVLLEFYVVIIVAILYLCDCIIFISYGRSVESSFLLIKGVGFWVERKSGSTDFDRQKKSLCAPPSDFEWQKIMRRWCRPTSKGTPHKKVRKIQTLPLFRRFSIKNGKKISPASGFDRRK